MNLVRKGMLSAHTCLRDTHATSEAYDLRALRWNVTEPPQLHCIPRSAMSNQHSSLQGPEIIRSQRAAATPLLFLQNFGTAKRNVAFPSEARLKSY